MGSAAGVGTAANKPLTTKSAPMSVRIPVIETRIIAA
jgi:hypothetical protein